MEIARDLLHPGDEDGQSGLFEAGEALRLACFVLQDADLLAQQPDLKIFFCFGQVTDSEEIENGSKTVSHYKPEQESTSSRMK